MVSNNKIIIKVSSFDTMVTMVDGNLDKKNMVTMVLFYNYIVPEVFPHFLSSSSYLNPIGPGQRSVVWCTHREVSACMNQKKRNNLKIKFMELLNKECVDRSLLKDKLEFWSCDYIVKEKVWNASEKVDHVACKYWCVLQGSGVIKFITNLAHAVLVK